MFQKSKPERGIKDRSRQEDPCQKKYTAKWTKGVPEPKRGETMIEQEVVDYYRDQLTPCKGHKLVEFTYELPFTSVGKPDRKALRKLQI